MEMMYLNSLLVCVGGGGVLLYPYIIYAAGNKN